MTPEFGGHHFFGPEDQIFYVDQESYLKFSDRDARVRLFGFGRVSGKSLFSSSGPGPGQVRVR